MSLPPLDNSIPVPKLCLNMIVKNESRIITRLLSSVCDLIDMYCICDTGSTDNTIEIIETFFKEKNIPGKIIEEPFQDFGYNRSYAMKACETMDADYLLLVDADMVFWRNPKIKPESFKQYLSNFDLFYIFQGTEAFYYKNARITKNKMGYSYWGVTHEYVSTPDNTRTGQIDKDVCFIKDIGDGGSKANKFIRDVALLKKGLEKEPNNDRYTFYLANSLKDSGQKQEAIETYKKRIEIGGWIEEIWQSYYSMGKCYEELGKMDNAICTWMEGYDAFPNRIENLYEIIKHYRIIGKHKLAYAFYKIADESRIRHKERDYLFMQKDVYDYKLDYEFSIFGFYYNPKNVDLSIISTRILTYPFVEEGIASNILSNYKFYCNDIAKHDTGKWKNNGLYPMLERIGSTLDIPSNKYPHFLPSTPTFCMTHLNKLLVNRRFVNYKINDNGGYDNHEYIETKNVLSEFEFDKEKQTWTLNNECFMGYKNEFDNRYVGLEDVRIMPFGDRVLYTANRGLDHHKMVIEHGWVNTTSFKTEDVMHLEYDQQRQIEKNWVMFPDQETMKIVYNWHPMIIGTLDKNVFHTQEKIQTPYLFKFLRGSTNGVEIGNEIWFLCHVVSYEDRRYYYHVMVMMEKNTRVIKHTRLFSFCKEKVEYTLGMMYKDDQLWIGYSLMDRSTHYISLEPGLFRDMLHIV